MSPPAAAAQQAARAAAQKLRRRVLGQMAAGAGVLAVPVAAWWYWSCKERRHLQEQERTRIRLPRGVSDTYDYLIAEKCQAGDVLLFDRRCERCAASPWAALACAAAKLCLTSATTDDRNIRSVDRGRYDHAGLIVPAAGGLVHDSDNNNQRDEAYNYDAADPNSLLLLEATPQGIVARPLKDRLEQTTAHSVLLLQLCSPGEQRNNAVGGGGDDDDNNTEKENEKETTPAQKAVNRAREHVERELATFRDRYLQAGRDNHYAYLHSTVTLGGALAHWTGLHQYNAGPVSPSAFLVLSGLQRAAAAPALSDRETRAVKVEDFLRDYRFTERDAVRLRPGWRFLAPVPLKQSGST